MKKWEINSQENLNHKERNAWRHHKSRNESWIECDDKKEYEYIKKKPTTNIHRGKNEDLEYKYTIIIRK